MELSKTYDPGSLEDKWYAYWLQKKIFSSVPNEKKSYTIVIPPPNVTGVLHMGHMLNNTIQDVLIRKARMQGYNACWVPGTDHASIATEAKVIQYLKEKGIEKKDLTREEFLAHAFEWKEKYGGIILQQLKKLGASCDWDRTKFTMDDDMSESVLRVFVDLYNKGFIYRGVRMIHWDPKAKTALSDEEVIYKEVQSQLYYIQYPIKDSSDYITIATTRPETILGDTAIAVHPNDKRYTHLHGKKAMVPIINREIPIITDEYVDMEFGTGALKITPAHDMNDYMLGIKHGLEVIDILNDDGTLNNKAQLFIGEDRFTARKKMVLLLDENKYLIDRKEIKNNVGYSERTDAVIEPRISLQWFCKMNDMAKPALENVQNGNIAFYPNKFINTYTHWMENIKDWCISRQLWWGQQIPVWYYGDGMNDFVVALKAEEAIKLASEKTNKSIKLEDLRQDEDVLDTRFSSWLWPISVFDGIRNPNNPEMQYYYPTQDLVTAPEIMFFWVARMIMAGYEYTGKLPFKNVYYTGIVRDKLRRKMSKSLGNSPDPLDLIEKYGADAVRYGMLYSSPAGNDLLFDEQYCEQGRNFCNKIWNSYRLIQGWTISDESQSAENLIAVNWINQKFSDTLEKVNDHFTKFRISDALMELYKFIWDDYCSWYLECIKPEYGKPIDQKTFLDTILVFEKTLAILHPFMPFITEELWQNISNKEFKESICITNWPNVQVTDRDVLKTFSVTQQLITEVRNFKKSKQISPKEMVLVFCDEKSPLPLEYKKIVSKLSFVREFKDDNNAQGNSIIIENNQYYIWIENSDQNSDINIEEVKKELEYTQGFLQSVLKKLSNEKFMQSAPQKVVESELKKKQDAEEKIKLLEDKLKLVSQS